MTSNRYPDASSYANGEVITTMPINQLTSDITAGDYMAPYYMGYCNYDETPKQCLSTRVTINSDGDIVFDEETRRNHGWGFVTCTASAGVPNVYNGYVNANGVITRVGSNGTSRFINKAVMARYAVTNTITIYMNYVVVAESQLDGNDTAYNVPDYSNNVYVTHAIGTGYAQLSATIPIISTDALGDGLDKFISNEAPINFGQINVAGTNVDVSVLASDFPDDNPTYRKVITVGGTNYVLFAQLSNYYYPVYGRYRRAADEVATAVSIVPFWEHDCLETDETIAKTDAKWICIGPPQDQSRLNIELEPQYAYEAVIAYFPNGAGAVSSGKVSMGSYYVKGGKMQHGTGADAYWYGGNYPNYPGYGRNGIIQGRHISYFTSNMYNNFSIWPMLRPKDIWFAIAPLHKIDTAHQGQSNTNPQNSYTATYSTEIFDNNVPTDVRKQDTTANLTEELMNWQMPSVDITVDEFDIGEMPSYEPTDNIMDKYTGDNIAFNLGGIGDADNYVTFWVMDKAMINTFGERLWKNLLSFDGSGNPVAGVWQNILIAKDTYFDTGSFDPSRIMDYIISLRYYPFELFNKATTTSPNTNIYFGSGKFGVNVTSVPFKLNNLAIDIDAGTIVIPKDADYLYKDFRDYDGSTAVMYLPFCGEYQIPISEIEPLTQFDIDYEVDVLSGACTAYVKVIHMESGHSYPILVANGQCGFDIPLSATNANRLNAQILGDAQRTVGSILEPFKQAASKIGKDISSAGQVLMGGGHADFDIDGANYVGAVAGPLAGVETEIIGAQAKAGMNLLNQAADMVTRPAIAMPLMQGSRGWAALANPLKPYIQLRRARYLYPDNYSHTMAKPECRTRKVSSIKGYAECANIDTSGLQCTETEKQMIKRTLETGFYRK